MVVGIPVCTFLDGGYISTAGSMASGLRGLGLCLAKP